MGFYFRESRAKWFSIFWLILNFFLLLKRRDLFQAVAFRPQLHTNRVIVGTWIFLSRKCVGWSKGFSPRELQRLGLILVFMNCSGYEVRWYVTYKRFFAIDARRKLYWLRSAHSCRRIFSPPLSLSFSIKLQPLNFIEAHGKKYR